MKRSSNFIRQPNILEKNNFAERVINESKTKTIIFQEWDPFLCRVGGAKFRNFSFSKENASYLRSQGIPTRQNRYTRQNRLLALEFSTHSLLCVTENFFRRCIQIFSIYARNNRRVCKVTIEFPIARLSFNTLCLLAKFFSAQKDLRHLEIKILFLQSTLNNLHYLFRAFRKLGSSLTFLRLKTPNCSISSQQLPRLMQRLRPFSSLSNLKALSVDFSHNNLRDMDIPGLITEVSNLKNLKSLQLNLSYNNFGSKTLDCLDQLRKECSERNISADINVSFNTRRNCSGDCRIF